MTRTHSFVFLILSGLCSTSVRWKQELKGKLFAHTHTFFYRRVCVFLSNQFRLYAQLVSLHRVLLAKYFFSWYKTLTSLPLLDQHQAPVGSSNLCPVRMCVVWNEWGWHKGLRMVGPRFRLRYSSFAGVNAPVVSLWQSEQNTGVSVHRWSD